MEYVDTNTTTLRNKIFTFYGIKEGLVTDEELNVASTVKLRDRS